MELNKLEFSIDVDVRILTRVMISPSVLVHTGCYIVINKEKGIVSSN